MSLNVSEQELKEVWWLTWMLYEAAVKTEHEYIACAISEYNPADLLPTVKNHFTT